MRARWIAACFGLVGTATAAALTALAQPPSTTAPAPAPVLHEDLRSPAAAATPRQRRGAGDPRAVLGQDPAAGHNPTAIRDDEKILPEPQATTQPASEEPIHGRSDFGADRRTESNPDYQTGGDDALRYVEVFNPSVVPFKRMSALDGVREDYTLAIASASQTELRVTGVPTPGYDRFWASMLIDIRPGEDVPIPSVAPEMRIVSYEVEPRAQLSFSVDGADNFYVRADEQDAAGVHRLVFLAEASPRYFAPSVPRGVRVSDLPAGRVRPLPDRVQRIAEQAHRRLGLRREMSVDDALARLVSYFRAFEAKPIRSPTGDVYWDLFTQQAGVCRHRSFAFMITANALGIPTRFVSNEAHAWVEVWIPRARGSREGGWIRIDLGGAALSLEVKNAGGKTMYRPRGEDPFPRPPEYSENYTRLEGDVSGLSQDQIAEAQTPRPSPSTAQGGDGASGGASGDATGDATGDEGGDEGGGRGADGAARPRSGAGADGQDGPDGQDGAEPDDGDLAGDGGEGDPAVPGPGAGLPAPAESAARGKRPTEIRVTGASPTGFRGETVAIEGVVAGAGDAGLPAQHVVLYLAPAGRGGAGAHVVGHAVTGPDGRFRADVLIPFELELTEHEVFASTPGDDKQQAAVSR
ncbi:MAG TPA: transglutaminase domain-containing protein [Kofleriaceae bacterium]|nr:transglutaminase domain-containing protein [Kofleriaceae bacterium]